MALSKQPFKIRSSEPKSLRQSSSPALWPRAVLAASLSSIPQAEPRSRAVLHLEAVPPSLDPLSFSSGLPSRETG
ncbi:uncharacterized protein SCHCODRAFT_02532690, partial [Schizophyllum commune H4-8]|uniref:uncharacterized protein n=1 Tax=Schizophyllum commune (strain H4-8 / FGSC 9210) TaxID=578458 RepID=UPI00215FA505